MTYMPEAFDFLLFFQHMAHGPINDADQDAAVHMCFAGVAVGLLIILAGIIKATGVWRFLIVLAGVIAGALCFIGIGFFGLMGL
jgi:hypothetical protein